jgi:hypothetical protein
VVGSNRVYDQNTTELLAFALRAARVCRNATKSTSASSRDIPPTLEGHGWTLLSARGLLPQDRQRGGAGQSEQGPLRVPRSR